MVAETIATYYVYVRFGKYILAQSTCSSVYHQYPHGRLC